MAGERIVPGLGLTAYWNLGDNGWKPGMDSNLLLLSAVAQLAPLSIVTSMPGSPTNGDIHIVDGGSEDNKVAIRDNGAWVYLTPQEGWKAWLRDSDSLYIFDGTAWVEQSSGGGAGTDLAYTASTRLLASSTGSDVTLPLVGSDAGLMDAADKTKLDGVASGATANSADSVLLDRANHTGTQAQSTITDLDTDLAAKAPINSPTFTGTVVLPDAQVVNGVTLSDEEGDTTFLRGDGVYATPSGGGGGAGTDLSYTASTRVLASSTGADATLPLVGSDPGLMTASDKTKLDGVASAATANSADAVLLARANHTGTQAQSTIVDLVSDLEAKAPRLTPFKIETASYGLVVGDEGYAILMNIASANDLTVPTNATQAIPLGATIFVTSIGAGQTTIVASGGVTIIRSETLKLRKQGSQVSLFKFDTNSWLLGGDLELI